MTKTCSKRLKPTRGCLDDRLLRGYHLASLDPDAGNFFQRVRTRLVRLEIRRGRFLGIWGLTHLASDTVRLCFLEPTKPFAG